MRTSHQYSLTIFELRPDLDQNLLGPACVVRLDAERADEDPPGPDRVEPPVMLALFRPVLVRLFGRMIGAGRLLRVSSAHLAGTPVIERRFCNNERELTDWVNGISRDLGRPIHHTVYPLYFWAIRREATFVSNALIDELLEEPNDQESWARLVQTETLTSRLSESTCSVSADCCLVPQLEEWVRDAAQCSPVPVEWQGKHGSGPASEA